MKPLCPGCRAGSPSVVRDGYFKRQCDSRLVQRFHCHHCGRRFSASTPSPRYRQKCRRINPFVQILLRSGVSQRRLAKLLRVSRTTLVRRIAFLTIEARERQRQMLIDRVTRCGPFSRLQFDELHTFEHTKCKPTAVCIVVDADDRFILGHSVAQIPASGPLAAISRKKYGYRADHGGKARFDWLFSINHTLAMLRANINRLIRRTWCTTKVNARPDDHIALYVDYHNRLLINSAAR